MQTTLLRPADTATAVEFKKNGLLLPENLTLDAWTRAGQKISEHIASASWALGDWLVYYENRWGRVPDGTYEAVGKTTGYAYQTLANAKHVCSKLPLSKRRNGLSFSHATEIVARVPDAQYAFWISKAVEGSGLTVKQLRESLRRTKAVYVPEPSDEGQEGLLEVARQCIRDCKRLAKKSTSAARAEARRLLGEAIKELDHAVT